MDNLWFIEYMTLYLGVYLIIDYFGKNGEYVKQCISELKKFDILIIIFVLFINFSLIYI